MTNPSGNTSSSVNVPASQAPQVAPLLIIRMPASKPWRRPKRPPPQVFRVDRADFRELVQRLTGAPASMNTPPSHPSEPVIEAGSAAPPLAISDRLQSYVEEEGRRFGEEHQNVWPSPAYPAPEDWIDTTTACFGRFQQPVAIGDGLQSYVEEEGCRFGEEHRYVCPSLADPTVGDWIDTTTACIGFQQPVNVEEEIRRFLN